MEELMKVPDSVIIKQLQDEVKALRRKNHEICVKAKERDARWKVHCDCLTEKIVELQRDDSDEEKKAIKREAKAIKKADEDYNNLLDQYNHLREKYEQLKEQMQYLKDELEGRPVGVAEISRKEIRKKFTNLKNRREIMDAMCFAYNESMPIAYNVVVFLEWVRVSGKWDELYARMYNAYTE
jgi:DNA repair exonuclease SbcCD ATPase subunit